MQGYLQLLNNNNTKKMIYEFKDFKLDSTFTISDNYERDFSQIIRSLDTIKILWNRSEAIINIRIDGLLIELLPNQITTTTYLQKFELPKGQEPLTIFAFNKGFYCIETHDEEVSCNGIIFFGTQDLPIVTLSEAEQRKFSLLYEVFIEEFTTHDKIQGEMLKVLLKRIIIKTTRLAKEQLITKKLENSQIEIIRRYNVLVDKHFKEKKQVSDYAELLNKSPKTLSNLFAIYNSQSPLRVIHERIILEARRLLFYSNKSITEIAYELGFDEVTAFSKLFKKITKLTPSKFKESLT